MDTPDNMDKRTASSGRPRLVGPRRRWWVLAAWAACLAGVVIGQYLTARSFPTGHWSPSGDTPATSEELLWYRLPLILIVAIGGIFSIAVRWLIPEIGSRKVIRLWGLWLGLPAFLFSLAMSAYYSLLVFYMD